MHHFIIFLPHSSLQNSNRLLYGVIHRNEFCTAAYILGCVSGNNDKRRHLSYYTVVGEINNEENKYKKTKPDWIYIELQNNRYEIKNVTVSSLLSSYAVSVILYDKDSIKKSQLLSYSFCEIQSDKVDHVFLLLKEVSNEALICLEINENQKNRGILNCLLILLLHCLSSVLKFTKTPCISTLINVSSFGVHFLNVLETIFVILSEIKRDNNAYNKLQCTNYIVARMFDSVIGQIIIYYVSYLTTTDKLFFVLTESEEYIVMYLKDTVEWLMGSPAGFKLNSQINNILGPFYQFHISLWWTFLRLSNPLLKIVFRFSVILGALGFSFQVSIFADILAIVTVHIYCIYVYATKIYYFQVKGLTTLSRLVIGKKRNPLPGSVDSISYTTEQLLLGTVSFTVLLFLLPTTFIYYSVFTAIRILLFFLGEMLTRLRYFMNIFPAYIILLWFYDPVRLTCTIKLSIKTKYFSDGTLVTRLKPVCKSIRETIVMCIPKSIKKPDSIEWKKLSTDILWGNLIYPI